MPSNRSRTRSVATVVEIDLANAKDIVKRWFDDGSFSDSVVFEFDDGRFTAGMRCTGLTLRSDGNLIMSGHLVSCTATRFDPKSDVRIELVRQVDGDFKAVSAKLQLNPEPRPARTATPPSGSYQPLRRIPPPPGRRATV